MTLTMLHVVLSMALVYSQFCRATKTDHNTRGAVLAAFYGLTAASIFSLFAPLVLPDWRPSWDTLALLLAMAIVQSVTSRYWTHGTPTQFQREEGKT